LRQYRLFVLKMDQAVRLDPDDFAPYYYLGRYYESELSDFSQAARYFEKAIERYPAHFRSHYHLGYFYEVEHQEEVAELCYRRAIELADRQHVPYSPPFQGLARLRLAANRAEEALLFAQRAVELDPKDASAHKLLGRIYSQLGRHSEAAAAWELSASLDPTDASSLYRLYRVYSLLGQNEKAESALSRYRRIAARYGTR